MKYNYLYTLLVLVFIVSSCETKWDNYGGYKMDYDSKLQHYIILDKSDTVCTNPLGYTHEGCRIIFHNPQGNIDTFCIDKGGTVIETYVDEVKYDDKFILVNQKLLGKICECNPDCLKEKYGKESHTATSFEFCKDALKKSKIHDYWIIVKATNDVYGPLSTSQYTQKRKALSVPVNLKLDFEK